jgi:twinkle protein
VDQKAFRQDPGGEQIFWRADCLADAGLTDEPLVICEGEFDAVAAIQAGFWRTVSVPGGAPAEASENEGDARASARYAFLREAMPQLESVREIIIAADGDGPGAALRSDLTTMLGAARCRFVAYPEGCKDLGDVLRGSGANAVAKCLRDAPWANVAGVYCLDELPPLPALTVWRPQVFDPIDKLIPICPGHVSVWTGLAGDGKSTLVNAVMWSLADRYGLKLCAAPFESTPQREYMEDLIAFRSGRAVGDRFNPATSEDIDEARSWARKHIVFLYADGFTGPGQSAMIDATVEWFVQAATTAIVRHGCRLIVLDPWSQIDHEMDSREREDQYVRRVLKRFKVLARTFDVHVAIVAHPAKPKRNADGTYPIPEGYDISGASHWKNAPDVGVTVYRDPPLIEDPENAGEMMPDPNSPRVLIKVWKVKFHRSMNRTGEAYAAVDFRTGRYSSAEHWEERTYPKRYPDPGEKSDD